MRVGGSLWALTIGESRGFDTGVYWRCMGFQPVQLPEHGFLLSLDVVVRLMGRVLYVEFIHGQVLKFLRLLFRAQLEVGARVFDRLDVLDSAGFL